MRGKVVFVGWAAIWILSLCRTDWLYNAYDLVFIRLQEAIQSGNSQVLSMTTDQRYADIWSNPRMTNLQVGVVVLLVVATLCVIWKFPYVRNTSTPIYRLWFVIALFLSWCFIRSEVVVASDLWEATWHWVMACLILFPWWLLRSRDASPNGPVWQKM